MSADEEQDILRKGRINVLMFILFRDNIVILNLN